MYSIFLTCVLYLPKSKGVDSMLDFRIYTFLTLSKTLNYTKAADILCITQPAVTQHIQYLEQSYQVKLFQHEGKHLSLTKQGTMLRNSIQTMAADEQHLRTTLVNSLNKIESIRFGATLTIGEFLMPEKLNRFLTKHPTHSLTMVVENTSTLLQMLKDGSIMFALVEGYFKKLEYTHHIISRERYVALKSRDYTLKKEVHTLADLLDERLILREEGSGTREILERILQENNMSVHDFAQTIEIGNMNTIKYLVEQTQGITFLYEAAVHKELVEGTLEIIPLDDFNIIREFNFIALKDSVFISEYETFLKSIL